MSTTPALVRRISEDVLVGLPGHQGEKPFYINGFAIPLPVAKRESFIVDADIFDAILMDYDATRVTKCCGDDAPGGIRTSFRRAFQAKIDEAVVLSLDEWPDEATRVTGMETFMKDHGVEQSSDLFFDGTRMIFGRPALIR